VERSLLLGGSLGALSLGCQFENGLGKARYESDHQKIGAGADFACELSEAMLHQQRSKTEAFIDEPKLYILVASKAGTGNATG